MRRRFVHLAFGVAALASATLATVQGIHLRQANRVNQAIAQASTSELEGSTLPQARFAHAMLLSSAGRYEGALAAHKALIQGERGELKLAALYNLGNLHLREALKNGPDKALDALPLIELAKQSYRDTLRGNPDDWDARYNLERALWLAPELDASAPEETEPPVPKERAVTRAPLTRIDLP